MIVPRICQSDPEDGLPPLITLEWSKPDGPGVVVMFYAGDDEGTAWLRDAGGLYGTATEVNFSVSAGIPDVVRERIEAIK